MIGDGGMKGREDMRTVGAGMKRDDGWKVEGHGWMETEGRSGEKYG